MSEEPPSVNESERVSVYTKDTSKETKQALLDVAKGGTKKAAKTTVTLASGRFLPLCTDKIRNNIKSRWQLMSIYFFGAAIVALLVVLTFYVPQSTRMKLSIAVNPPSVVELGAQWQPFSVQVTDEHNQPIPGMKMYVGVSPTKNIPISLRFPDGATHISREIECLQSLMLPQEPHSGFDLSLCMTASTGLLVNRTAITNDHGLAVFENVTLAHGSPGDYLVAIANTDSTLILTTFTLVVATVSKIETQVVSKIEETVNNVTYENIGEPFSVTAEMTFTSADMPYFAAAAVIPLSLQDKPFPDSPYIPFPLEGDMDKAVHIKNNFAFAWNFTNTSEGLWKVVFHFNDLVLMGANSPQIFLGVYCFGTVGLIQHIQLYRPQQNPSILFIPLQVVSPLGKFNATLHHINVTETERFKMSLVAFNRNGTPRANAYIYLRSRPSLKNGVGIGDVDTFSNPGFRSGSLVRAKKLLFRVVQTDEHGKADIEPRFSAIGATGFYDILVECDGIPAVFPDGETFATIDVKSKATFFDFRLADAPWLSQADQEIEIVHQQWRRLPAVRVLDVHHVPIPGKMVSVTCEECGIKFWPIEADDDGWGNFARLNVTWAKFAGVHTFKFYVDRILAYSFQKQLSYDPSEDLDKCAEVQWTSWVPTIYQGVQYYFQLRAISTRGLPVSHTPVMGLIFAGIIRDFAVPFGYNVTDGNGEASLPIRAMGVRTEMFVPVGLCCYGSCDDNGITASVEPMVPRARKITAVSMAGYTPEGNGIFHVSIDADWSHVSAENPLEVSSYPVWAPAYVADFYNPLLVPRSSVDRLNSSRHAALHTMNELPGTYFLLCTIDNAIYLVPTVGSSYPSIFPITGVGFVTDIFIVQSAFGANVTIRQGYEFPVQPILRVLDNNNDPLEGQNVSAQIGVRRNGVTTWIDYLNPETIRNISTAAIVLFPQFPVVTNPLGVDYRPLSPASDSNGYIRFSRLGILGALPGVELRIRYCSYFDLLIGNSVKEVCVEESESLTFSSSQQHKMLVSISSFTTTPGTPFQSITVTIQRSDGSALPFMLLAPYVDFTAVEEAEGASFLVTHPDYGESPFISKIRPLMYLGGTNDILKPDGDSPMMLDPSTPSGDFLLYFAGPGVTSSAIRVSSNRDVANFEFIASSVTVAGFPPKANMALQNVYTFVLRVSAASGAPIPGQSIELGVKPLNKDCMLDACGVLSASTNRIVQTDTNGLAIFTISFSGGANGEYVGKLALAPALSVGAIQNGIANDMKNLRNIFGAPTSSLSGEIQSNAMGGSPGNAKMQSYAGNLGELFDTMNKLQSTKSAFDSNSLSALNGLVGKLRSGDSSFKKIEKFLPFKQPLELESNPFWLHNRVHRIEVVYEANFVIEVEQKILENVVGATLINYTLTAENAPQVKLFGKDGEVVDNVSLTVYVLPLKSSVDVYLPPVMNSSNGVVGLAGARIMTRSFGDKFQFHISSNGGGAIVVNATFAIRTKQTWTLAKVMKYCSWLIALSFSPMFLGSVPHSRPIYTIFSVSFALCLAISSIILATKLNAELVPNFLVRAYMIFVIVSALVLFAISVGTTIIELLGRGMGKYNMKFLNDEPRAYKILRYTRWITNVKIDKQEVPQVKKSVIVEKVNSRLQSIRDAGAAKIENMEVELLGTSTLDRGPKWKKKKVRPALIIPQDIDIATTYPFNFLIVASITVVLLVALTLFGVNMYLNLKMKLRYLLSYLPDPSSGVDVNQVNSLLTSGITYAIMIIIGIFPQYSFLAALTGPLKDINLIEALATFRSFVDEFLDKLNIAFAIGITTAGLVVLGTIAAMALQLPKLMLQVRRREIVRPAGLAPTEGYIGLHCFHFVIVHQIIMWPVILVVLILMVERIRTFLLEQTWLIITASLVSFVIQFAMVKILAGWFLTDTWMLLRPEMYSIWHFVGLVLGIFTGLMKSFVRWITGIVLYSTLFASLDKCIYPPTFSAMDKAYTGFMNMMAAEAKNSNPIFLTAAAYLTLEIKLRALADEGENTVEADGFGDEDYNVSAVIRNLWKMQLRWFEPANKLPLWEAPSVPAVDISQFATVAKRKTLERVRNRWWLLYLLHQNPSLRRDRKHALFEIEPKNISTAEVVEVVADGF